MNPLRELLAISATLKIAAAANAAGELGERELLAISMAADEMIRNINVDPQSSTAYAGFSKVAQSKIADRIAELDRGEA